MKTVSWIQFLVTMTTGGLIAWLTGKLAFAAFMSGLSYIGVPLALTSIGTACLIIRAIGALFEIGTEDANIPSGSETN